MLKTINLYGFIFWGVTKSYKAVNSLIGGTHTCIMRILKQFKYFVAGVYSILTKICTFFVQSQLDMAFCSLDFYWSHLDI